MPRVTYLQKIEELHYTEELLGEMAALLAEISDALIERPGAIRLKAGGDVVIGAGRAPTSLSPWPSRDSIADLLNTWRKQSKETRAAWMQLSKDDQARMEGPATRSAPDPLKPMV